MRSSSVYIFDSPPMSAGDWPDDNEDTENKDDVKNAVDVLQYKVRAGVR